MRTPSWLVSCPKLREDETSEHGCEAHGSADPRSCSSQAGGVTWSNAPRRRASREWCRARDLNPTAGSLGATQSACSRWGPSEETKVAPSLLLRGLRPLRRQHTTLPCHPLLREGDTVWVTFLLRCNIGEKPGLADSAT